jgi:serine phosphatase RsbU (regulator of sigma subunit)
LGEFDAYQCIYPENENITWFGGPDGLFRYDASVKSNADLNFKTKIRGVYCMNDTLFGGYYGFNENGQKITAQPESFIPELIYKNNNINFEFAALSFDNEKENVYSYYLEGFDNNWSEWTTESKKNYTNLNEGTYTFHIKSKNVYGKEGEEDTYTFTILPPWYRTGWAYLGYFIGAVICVYFITQISVRRLKRAKERLEAIVINRTAEVVAEKEEVEKQKKIVEVKNKDITDSINYAQRIQQAILPLPEDFSKVFPESFIYFQPRDIVSGDFYWFNQPKKTERNWVYIAVADCTGHGVPGAFMSMIGNTLLNEILNEKQIYETDQILNHLHVEVRAALKQDTAQNTTNDGMDIALCRIDLDTLELQYSGANRALYIFKNAGNQFEFIDIKPNKFPIGGYQAETTRSFTPHLIQLQHKDTFYIFSDGYADQFGGISNKKFMVKRLQNELMAMQNLSLNEQKYLVQKLVMDWKGEAEQVDDILMIGVRV